MLTSCRPDEVPALLRDVLAGQATIIPIAGEGIAAALDSVSAEPAISAGVIVATSGSTGAPKFVQLPAAAMRAAADGFRAEYGSFTWHCALPLHYVAGVMAVVRGICDEDFGGGYALVSSDLSDLAARDGRNAVCIVPTQLRRSLADRRIAAELVKFDLVVVGGAPCPPELREAAQAAGIRLLMSYGMSETCGGVVYDGKPLPGVEIAFQDGRVKIKTPSLAAGYLGNPELTAQIFVGGWLLTNDRGRWLTGPTGERLQILGRVDDVVITGGVNVDLAELQRVLDSLEVDGVAVVAVPDAEWGQRIVLAAPSGELATWREKLRPLVGSPALPRQLVLGELPRTSSGKLDREALRRRAAAEWV